MSQGSEYQGISLWLDGFNEGYFVLVEFEHADENGTFEPEAYPLILRTLAHTATDTSEEWHFRQRKTGFVVNNSKVMRRNLRRSIRYINYAPIETSSNFLNNFAKSLSEIEE